MFLSEIKQSIGQAFIPHPLWCSASGQMERSVPLRAFCLVQIFRCLTSCSMSLTEVSPLSNF